MLTRLGTAAIVVSAITLLLFIGLHRLVAGDEAFYTLAIRLVAEGKTPYRDFFYPQMPLLPCFYISICYLVGEPDWYLLRIVASLGATATVFAVFWFLLSYTTWFIAACSLLLLITSPLFFPWITTIQTYSLTAPLVLLSALLTEILRKSLFTRKATATDVLLSILAGASLSMATQTRLYSAALLPIFYIYMPQRLKLWLLFSFFTCCIPSAVMLIESPHRFWFNNIGYHLLRAHGTTERQISGKIQMLLILLGARPTRKFIGFNTAILFWSGIAGSINLQKIVPVIALTSLTLCVISFVPTPSYYQYFTLVAPFWSILCGVQIFRIIKTPVGRRLHLRVILPLCLVLISLIGFHTNLEKYLQSGSGFMGIPRGGNPADFSLKASEEVSETINTRFGPDDIIFASWNGYLLKAKARLLAGSENVFSIRTASRFPKISEENQLTSYDES